MMQKLVTELNVGWEHMDSWVVRRLAFTFLPNFNFELEACTFIVYADNFFFFFSIYTDIF